MWRARVLEVIHAGRVVVEIPDLYGRGPVGPMQATIEVEVDEAVVVADLNPTAKVHDWLVVGRTSEIGRWGTPYPHTHPTGQVTALDANGQETTLTAILAQKADKADVPGAVDTSGYATKVELSEGLATKVNTSAMSGYATTTALAAKANLPGAWSTITSSFWVVDTTASRALSIRSTPFGMQLSGRVRLTSTIAMDAVVATLPSGFAPTFPHIVNIPTMGPGSTYVATKSQLELQIDGTITAREALTSGSRLSFNETVIY